MIRWYDWTLALIAADVILASVVVAFVVPNILLQVFAVLAVGGIWDLWEHYCRFRKKQETNR